MINPFAFTIAAALIIILVKLSSFLAPFNLYFSFSTIFVGSGSFFPGKALAIKMLIPFMVGFLLYYIPIKLVGPLQNFSVAKRIRSYLGREAIPSCRAAAFFSALLLAWPMIVHWDILAAFEVREYKRSFLFVYLLYFIAYAFFASAGVRVAALLTKKRHSESGAHASGWIETSRDSFIGAIAGGTGTAVLHFIIRD